MAESAAMPVRATKRGDERTPLGGERDVLICGASFAGLAVARELAGSGADVLILDRYEIGERQTSACGIPTEWLRAPRADGVRAPALRHPGHAHPPRDQPLPAALDLLDLRLPRALPAALARLRRPVRDRQGQRPCRCRRRAATGSDRSRHRPRHDQRAAGRRRARLAPDAGLRRRLPAARRAALARPRGAPRRRLRGPGDLDRPQIRARRLRLVVPGPRRAADRDRLLRPPLPRQGHDRRARPRTSARSRTSTRETGSPTSCAGRPRAASSSPATPPATACRSAPRASAPRSTSGSRWDRSCAAWSRAARAAPRRKPRYASFHDTHEWKFKWMLRVQKLIPRVPPRLLAPLIRLMGDKRFVDWSFDHYLRIAPPEYAGRSGRLSGRRGSSRPAAGRRRGCARARAGPRRGRTGLAGRSPPRRSAGRRRSPRRPRRRRSRVTAISALST